MTTSTKVIFGVYGAFVGVWLAGSAYFLVNGRDEELEEGLIQGEEPLPREENAYYLFPKLHEMHQTNYNFTIANDFVNGWTNSPAVLAEVSELVDAHSNLFVCARQIVACRGYRVPEGESKMAAVGPLCSHPTARLYQMKARCEALRGDRKAAQATIDELIAFGRFVRRTGTVVGYLVGVGYIGMAMEQGGRSPIATPEDCAWLKHLVDVLQEQEASSAELSGLPLRENWLAGSLMWDVRSVYKSHFRSLFAWRAGRLRLACENYRSVKGRYPTELAELLPDCIATVPFDPYDGQPIRYNAEHGYFWTPGPDGAFNGKVDFDEDCYPRWKNRNYHFVQLLDTTKRNRPPSTYCNMSRRKTPKRAK